MTNGQDDEDFRSSYALFIADVKTVLAAAGQDIDIPGNFSVESLNAIKALYPDLMPYSDLDVPEYYQLVYY